MSLVIEHWSFDPFLVVVLGIVALHELGLANLARRSAPQRIVRRRRRSALFYGGLALLLVSVESPIDYWASSYFFVHMIEHVLIMLFAPWLVVAGAPWLPLIHGVPVRLRRAVGRFLLLGPCRVPLRGVARLASSGPVAVTLFIAVMVLWHIPSLFDLGERNGVVHVWAMHGSFFLVGVLFWLQITPSHPFRPRLTPAGQIGALFVSNVAMFLLAMALSIFSRGSWYGVYAAVPGVTLSPFADQQIGAAILWVCGDFWAAPALVGVVRKVIREEGGFGVFADRVLHRAPVPGLEFVPARPAQLRSPSTEGESRAPRGASVGWRVDDPA